MASTPIQTTVVGSYPIPAWLAAYPSAGHLRDALLVVLKTQELAGIDVIADGELSRFDVNHPETNGMIDYFIAPLEGVRTTLTRTELSEFHKQAHMGFRTRPAGVVQGPISEGGLDLPAGFASVQGLTDRQLKFTITSPYMLARTLLDLHYGDLRKLTTALAEVLREQAKAINADALQIDEANLPGSPEDGPWVAQAINTILDGARGQKGVHLCFGNYGGQTIQTGFFRELLPFFNALECDHLILEFARRGDAELDVFKELKPSIALGVGVIDIKDNEVETPDIVARRIETAIKTLGAERIRWVHPDCGFWMLPRSVADRKMRALVEGRDLYLGSWLRTGS